MKTCPKEEILQAYCDGELNVPRREQINAHLMGCAFCVQAIEEIEESLAMLGNAFAAEKAATVPTMRLQARIESALAEQAAPRFAWAMWFGRLGWAMTMLVVTGVIGWALLGRTSLQQTQQAHIETTTPLIALPSSAPLFPALEAKPKGTQQASRPRHRVPRRATSRKPEVAETVTEFYPLREGEDLEAMETMQLVRVELPSSALEEVGLAITTEAAHKSVKADVMLGTDGLARAIRFVR